MPTTKTTNLVFARKTGLKASERSGAITCCRGRAWPGQDRSYPVSIGGRVVEGDIGSSMRLRRLIVTSPSLSSPAYSVGARRLYLLGTIHDQTMVHTCLQTPHTRTRPQSVIQSSRIRNVLVSDAPVSDQIPPRTEPTVVLTGGVSTRKNLSLGVRTGLRQNEDPPTRLSGASGEQYNTQHV